MKRMVDEESGFVCLCMIRSEDMVFNTGAALLDAVVLAIVSREAEGTYGYKITQDVRTVVGIHPLSGAAAAAKG